MLNMRPPVQPTTLQQQNEGTRQHYQQQTQQQQQTKFNGKQLQQQQQIAHSTKLPQHDILVEKHSNSTHTTKPASIAARKGSTTNALETAPTAAAAAAAPVETKLTTATTTTYQVGNNLSLTQNAKQRSNRLHNPNNDTPSDNIIDDKNDTGAVNVTTPPYNDSIQLVDLSTSPPFRAPLLALSPLILPLPSTRHASEQRHTIVSELIATPQPQPTVHTQRSSIISNCQYSTQSSISSPDDVSSNAGDQQHQHHLYRYSSSRASSFDDAAENFIINFPSADSFLTHTQNDCIVNLPLSETEPLLTNIEATVADKRRSICLSKNSAALIFTKKELPPTNNNYNNLLQKQPQQKQQQQQQKQLIGQTGLQHSSNNLQTRRCQSLRVASNEKSNRRPTKHLPATYHQQQQQKQPQQKQQQQHQQQQRRSLQLNYNNNNLVTTSTCTVGNNNNYCPSTIKGNGGAVLHRHHGNPSSTAAPLNTAKSGFNEARSTAATTTTTTTRKQHAYSWYAPVYSALEEELEQDSRDSSPIHNLANSKKNHSSSHYQHRSSHKTSAVSDNETVALLETRNQINIQAQLHAQAQQQQPQIKGSSSSSGGGGIGGTNLNDSLPTLHRKTNGGAQALSLQLNTSTNNAGVVCSSTTTIGQATNSNSHSHTHSNYEGEGGSLGLTGGPLPRRRRLENLEKFFKSLVGLRPSSASSQSSTSHVSGSGSVRGGIGIEAASQNISIHPMPLPASPEIRITRTPSDQNVDAGGKLLLSSTEKLAQGSTSSLNVVQQKLWNIMRREGSAASLYNEKSQSGVQYSGLRKCETVLALTTRQGNTPHSPVYTCGHRSPRPMSTTCAPPYMGSGVFSANGVEKIHPLNRLRNSVTSMNAMTTCSRCSSLLSLAATGSRYSLNATANVFVNTIPVSVSQQLQLPQPPTSTIASPFNFTLQPQSHQQRRYTAGMVNTRRFKRSRSCSTSSRDEPQNDSIGALPRKISTCSCTSCSSVSCSRKSSTGAQSTTTNSSISPPSNRTTATLISSLTPSSATTTATGTATVTSPHTTKAMSSPTTPTITPTASTTPIKIKDASSPSELLTVPLFNLTPTAQTSLLTGGHDAADGATTAASTTETTISTRPFQIFTCKLCLIDVEFAGDAMTLIQCGCQFCTECMKAYVEFEISEGAYEISCPDAQCPAQGVMTLPEIANLTTGNLMKKHHRYRLNREIELDKTRTWCPRAGCETVCRVGDGAGTLAPSTSSALNMNASPTSPLSSNGSQNAQAQSARCGVICPSCKDEFCSSCKKTWHPNITCDEHSRRLVADGQDDIGIPFDNDLIKCCPMCAVPIEKDEGCAQMMCKRCKHVFCWYCLASLDDDFLLRHYDKGPCKNKLGHSRASVVWHRAQVIGIFAGFGILLLVASPLLLLAAPCIICCKCRSCSGSKIDEGDTDLEEATALQS